MIEVKRGKYRKAAAAVLLPCCCMLKNVRNTCCSFHSGSSCSVRFRHFLEPECVFWPGGRVAIGGRRNDSDNRWMQNDNPPILLVVYSCTKPFAPKKHARGA